MRQRHDGFVLLIVLVYLQLLVLLNITNIKQLMLLNKQIRLLERHAMFHNLMMNIVNKINEEKIYHCEISPYPVRYIQQQSRSWWEAHACSGVAANFQYYFYQSDLGRDDCAVVDEQASQFHAAHYYRITLMIDSNPSVIAQVVMIRPDKRQPSCTQTVRKVHGGKSVLRWL